MEAALTLPLVAVFVLLIAQFGLVVRDQLDAWHLAREAARAISIADDPEGVADDPASVLPPLRGFRVRAVVRDALVTVTVRRTVITALPLIGHVLPDVGVSAEVTMALEPPLAS